MKKEISKIICHDHSCGVYGHFVLCLISFTLIASTKMKKQEQRCIARTTLALLWILCPLSLFYHLESFDKDEETERIKIYCQDYPCAFYRYFVLCLCFITFIPSKRWRNGEQRSNARTTLALLWILCPLSLLYYLDCFDKDEATESKDLLPGIPLRFL